MFEVSRLKSILESLIFASESPLKVSEMLKALQSLQVPQEQEAALPELSPSELVSEPSEMDAKDQLLAHVQKEEGIPAPVEEEKVTVTETPSPVLSNAEINQALRELQQYYLENTDRGIALVEVAGGWQFRTKPENADCLRYFFQPKPVKLSKPSLETLSVIAYRQPITRAEVDNIRGVDSGGVVKTLLEKNLIRIVGKKEEPGKPVLYGTTSDFLELFQLKNLKDLPTLRDYADLEEELRQQSERTGLIISNKNPKPESDEEEGSLSSQLSSTAIEDFSPEEEELLGELDDSLGELKKLEQEIFEVPTKNAAAS